MNSFKIFLLILLVGLGLGACNNNFLTPDLDNQYTKDRFLKDPAYALGMMLNGYSTSSALPGAYPFDEVATDDAVSNDVGNAYLRMATGEWSAIYDPTSVWSSAYRAILNINYFLSIVDNVEWSWQDTVRSEIMKTRYKSESYGLRGYYYYQLLEHNGGIASSGDLLGVPIVTGVLTSKDDWRVQRSTFAESLAQTASDLDSAIMLLPYEYKDISNPVTIEDIDFNRVNGSNLNVNLMDGRHVRAYKAKLYLLAGSPAFNGGTNYDVAKLDTAVQILGKLITVNGGLTSLSADPIFWNSNSDVTPATTANKDILWRNNYTTDLSREADNFPPSLYGHGRVNPTQNLVDAFPMSNGLPITDPASGYDLQNPYANRDPRLALDILYNGGTPRLIGSGTGSANPVNTQADNPVTDRNDGLNKQVGYSTRTGYYLKKLLRVAVNLTPGSESSQIHYYARLRWTELFLSFAEAANEVYGPDGGGFAFTPRQIIEALRARGAGTAGGGITQPDIYLASITDKAGMRDLIRNERRIELCFEGHRFWDLRRWNVPLSQLTAAATGVSITGTSPAVYTYTGAGVNPVENRVYQSYMYYGPIPYIETQKYPGFLQNKGW